MLLVMASGIAQPQPHLTLQSPRLALPLPCDPALEALGFHQPLHEQRHWCAAWSYSAYRKRCAVARHYIAPAIPLTDSHRDHHHRTIRTARWRDSVLHLHCFQQRSPLYRRHLFHHGSGLCEA